MILREGAHSLELDVGAMAACGDWGGVAHHLDGVAGSLAVGLEVVVVG